MITINHQLKMVSEKVQVMSQRENEQPIKVDESEDNALDSNRQLRPPRSVVAVSAVCVLLIACARWYEPLVGYEPPGALRGIAKFFLDHAHVNLFTYILAFIALIAPMIWFATCAMFSWLIRCLPLACLAAVIVFPPFAFEIRVNGEMVPIFRPRWLPVPDSLLTDRTNEAKEVDLRTTTAFDFPQFLGPDRNLVIDEIHLEHDWKTHPPKLLWRQPIGAGWSGFVAVNGYAVTMEQRGENELVTCYEVKTGQLCWTHETKTRHDTAMGGIGPRSTPAIHEGKVYSLGATGVLNCLDGATGDEIWSKNLLVEFNIESPAHDLREIAWGRANSPLIVNGMVIVPAGGPQDGQRVSLVAYDCETGEKQWEAGTSQISYSSPNAATFGGKRQIIIVNENSLSGFDLQGAQLWTFPWDGNSAAAANVPQAVPLPPNRVFVSKGYSQGAMLLELVGGRNPQTVWANETLLKTKFANVAIKDGFVYGLSDGILECVELDSGERRWKRGRYGHGQLLLVRDVLLVQAEQRGEVVMVEASHKQFRELGRIEGVKGKAWNNLCLYENLLLVRSGEEAACYELTTR